MTDPSARQPLPQPTDARADWPQIGDIVVNHDGDRPEATDALAGRSFALRLSDKTMADLQFSVDRLQWREGDARVDDAYRAYRIREGCYFVHWISPAGRRLYRSLFLDLAGESALLIEGRIPAPEDNRLDVLTRIARRNSQSMVDVVYRMATFGAGEAAIERTSELIGKCLRYRYSDTHLYDHIYHSERYYSWFCHEGPDRGLGDFEECDYFKLRPDLYLICWREKLLPCLAVMIEDHQTMRSMGRICGGDAYTGEIADTLVGARMSLLADIGVGKWTGEGA